MAKKTCLTMTMVAMSLAAIGIVHAQQTNKKATAGNAMLAPEDYLDIQQLVARYAYALDTGADNGYAYADLFAPGGEFVGTNGSTKGRDALAKLGQLGFVNGHKPTFGVSHFIMNHVIEPAPGGATGKEYLVLVNIGENSKPGGEFSNVGGHYEDVYAKTPDGWRFKRREFIPIKSNPPTR